MQWEYLPKPAVILEHKEGPVLRMPNGSMHWITLGERIGLSIGFYNLKSLVKRYEKKMKGQI